MGFPFVARVKKTLHAARVMPLLLAGVLHGQGRDAMFPPSRYIGLYDEYLGVLNGALPETTPRYTGPWKWEQDGRVLIEGTYTDGIPSGEWREFSGNGVLRRLCVYAADGAYEETSFYADGQPRLLSTGRIFFNPAKVVRRVHSMKRMKDKTLSLFRGSMGEQTLDFPRIRFFPSFSGFAMLRNGVGDAGDAADACFEYHVEVTGTNIVSNMGWTGNTYALRVFYQDGKDAPFWPHAQTGVLDWENNTAQSFGHTLGPFFYDLSFERDVSGKDKGWKDAAGIGLKITTLDRHESPARPVAFERLEHDVWFYPKKAQLGGAAPAMHWLAQPPDMIQASVKRHLLASPKIINLETNEEYELPFHVVASGYYIPGEGWTDVSVEPVGNAVYEIPHPCRWRYQWEEELDKDGSHVREEAYKAGAVIGMGFRVNAMEEVNGKDFADLPPRARLLRLNVTGVTQYRANISPLGGTGWGTVTHDRFFLDLSAEEDNHVAW